MPDNQSPGLHHITTEVMSSSVPFHNLIRFLDESLVEHYGDVKEGSLDNIKGSRVETLRGDLYSLESEGQTAVVHEVRCPWLEY